MVEILDTISNIIHTPIQLLSKCKCVSNQHVVHFKYLSFICQICLNNVEKKTANWVKMKKKKDKKRENTLYGGLK